MEGKPMEDICRFIPPVGGRNIVYRYFVYEAELERLAQPFYRTCVHMHLAFKGQAILKINGERYRLTPGTLFVTFPYQEYEITESENFTFLYIAFEGAGATELLEQFGVIKARAVFKGFGHLTEFWMNAIRRVNPGNILVLTESVVLYTLSFLGQSESEEKLCVNPRFDAILEYIRNNFADPELSISKVADIFGFNKKYISALFVKNLDVKFTDYLAKIRIDHAVDILRREKLSVSDLAERCGFADPFYFSKVFKRITGVSPSQYPAENIK